MFLFKSDKVPQGWDTREMLTLTDTVYLTTFSYKCLLKTIGHILRFGKLLVVELKTVTSLLSIPTFMLSSSTENQCMITAARSRNWTVWDVQKLENCAHSHFCLQLSVVCRRCDCTHLPSQTPPPWFPWQPQPSSADVWKRMGWKGALYCEQKIGNMISFLGTGLSFPPWCACSAEMCALRKDTGRTLGRVAASQVCWPLCFRLESRHWDDHCLMLRT